jgi:transcriptional regulator with XRE-family HTH domain
MQLPSTDQANTMSDTKIRRTKGSVVHPRIGRAIGKIGADISLARRVRQITVQDFAVRIGVSRATLSRLEHGDPGISLNTFCMALHAIGRLDALTQIADAVNDHVTKPARSSPEGGGEDTSDEHTKIKGKFEGF